MYKKVLLAFLILGILLIIPFKCNNTEFEDKYNAQKELVKQLSEKRIKERDSLNFLISQREVTNSFLMAENERLKNKVVDIKNRPFVAPKGLEAIVMHFNERYKTTENKVVVDKVGLTEDTATDVVYELEEGDKAMLIVPIQEEVIKSQDSVIVNLNKDKQDLKTMNASSEQELLQTKKLINLADKNIEQLQKKVENNKFWTKVLVGAGAAAGYFIGHGISNK